MLLWTILGLMFFTCSLSVSKCTRWPAGTYGLPKPVSGCPWSEGILWREGWRSQATFIIQTNNSRSPEFHLDGKVNSNEVKRSFCIKYRMTSDRNRPPWPKGKYCIYKKYPGCPEGLTSGELFWDDQDGYQINDDGGVLPEGRYNHDTTINFCCRTDGDRDDPVLLPVKSPFFLLAYESAKCQMVKWAVSTVEWIHYDTEDWDNQDEALGCNETLTSVSGTFHSPNYPRNYPHGQYCSWKIKVNTTLRIRLTFKNFSLQIEKNTDQLYVYDGENETGKILDVFYGDHPPPKEGIYSSSNSLFVIFKSNKNDSFAGFSAYYDTIYDPGCNETLTSVNGIFRSPNYPRNYPHGQYCSWKIKVNTTLRIRLMFTDFSLQIEKNTDQLYVYDGENATGKILDVFYGDHPPPKEGIYSSSNSLFVIFKSDKNDSYAGFSAYYDTVDDPDVHLSTTPAPMVSKNPKLTQKSTSITAIPSEEIEPCNEREHLGVKGTQAKREQATIKKDIVYGSVIGILALLLVVSLFYQCRKKHKRK
nr:cubilin homolog isoform X2 [Pocillopora verrucosa]